MQPVFQVVFDAFVLTDGIISKIAQSFFGDMLFLFTNFVKNEGFLDAGAAFS